MILKSKRLWGSVIAVLLLAFCVKDVRIDDIVSLFHRINLIFLIPATIAAFAFIGLKALRWRLVVNQHKVIPLWRCITLYSAGQILNVVMPVLTGQIGRIILFSKKEGLRKSFVFSTIFLEVLFDAVTLVLFLFLTSLAFVFPSEYRHVSAILIAVTSLVIILLYGILTFQHGIQVWVQEHVGSRWRGVSISIRRFFRSFTKGIRLLRSTPHMVGAVTISLLGWVVHALVIYFLFRCFDFGLPFASACAVMIINTLALMIPITPGNAGTFELAVTASLTAFSINRADAVLFAISLHLLDLLPVFVLGSFFVQSEKVSIADMKHQADLASRKHTAERPVAAPPGGRG
jgi:glycosyltransferase 2 family protein